MAPKSSGERASMLPVSIPPLEPPWQPSLEWEVIPRATRSLATASKSSYAWHMRGTCVVHACQPEVATLLMSGCGPMERLVAILLERGLVPARAVLATAADVGLHSGYTACT